MLIIVLCLPTHEILFFLALLFWKYLEINKYTPSSQLFNFFQFFFLKLTLPLFFGDLNYCSFVSRTHWIDYAYNWIAKWGRLLRQEIVSPHRFNSSQETPSLNLIVVHLLFFLEESTKSITAPIGLRWGQLQDDESFLPVDSILRRRLPHLF